VFVMDAYPFPVSKYMVKKVITVAVSHTVQSVCKTMYENNIGCLVITKRMTSGLVPVGIVTERDLVTQVCCREASSNEYIIRHIMSSPVATIDPDSTVETAASLMQQNKVKHLVVVDEKKTAGIITSSNLIKYLDGRLELDDVNAKILATAFSEEPM
jgi:CBS domain-containing protein